MTLPTQAIAVLAALLLSLTPAAALGQDGEVSAGESAAPVPAAVDSVPHVVCVDDVCRVTDEPRPDEPSLVDAEGTPDPVSDSSGIVTDPSGTGVGPLVCLEGEGACSVVDGSVSIEELRASSAGRLVYGAVDADPSGTWRATSLPARVRCKIEGAGRSSVKLKRTRARTTIERQASGSLIGKSRREGEPPFRMVRLGPGLYGSIQRFAQDNVTGVIVSYYGLLTPDKIAGTSLVTSTFLDGGPRTDCILKRNFDMKRISGPATTEPTIAPSTASESEEAATSD
ncbi:MAG: hypothetical protein ACC726_17375 [Chloroflexota bacterium]